MMGLDNLKAKINRFYPKKIILGTIWGDVFLYISLLNLITSPILVATVFFYSSSDPPSWRYSFFFILSSFFHLHSPRVNQVAGIDPCPISTFLKSLGVAIRLKITVQVSLPHYSRPFCDFGLDYLLLYCGPNILNKRVGTGPIVTHLKLACV